MVYQEMLCLPNLSVSANIFCGREICRFGRLDEAAMRVAHASGARSPVVANRSGRARRIAVRRASPTAPGRARAGVRLPDPRARRADDGAHRRGSRSPVRRAARVEEGRHDDPLRLASTAGSVPALRSHHRASRRIVRRHLHDREREHQRHRQGDGRTRASETVRRTFRPSVQTNVQTDVQTDVQTIVCRSSTSRDRRHFREHQPGRRRGEIVGALRPRRLRTLRAARNHLRPSSAGLRRHRSSTARRCRFDRRATRLAPASCWCPKSVTGRRCSSTSISGTTS